MNIQKIMGLGAIAAGVGVAALLLPATAEARDQIRIVGSSTVYPFTAAVAERFGQGGSFKTPIVEATGTGGGIKLFCEGVGPEKPDIANASRQIKDSEIELCKKNGVAEITEIPVGFDGIVLANAKTAPRFSLTSQQIFMALAKRVPKDGALVDNYYKAWNEVDPSLPAEPIEVYGPPPTSGTRDAFVELALEKPCVKLAEYAAAYPDESERKKQCHQIREDGKYIDAGENDNIIVQKLTSNPMAVGVFGYSFLEQNASTVQGSIVDGVEPTFENILAGKYAISRSMYVYAKNAHLKVIPGIKEFLVEFTSEAASGPDGYLAAAGLIPLDDAGREAARAKANGL